MSRSLWLLPEQDRERLLAAGTPRELERGAAVVHQGEHGDSLFWIVEGEVEVLVTHDDLEGATIVATLPAGQTFGEHAASHEGGSPRSATVRCAAPTRLIEVPGVMLRELLVNSPQLAARIEEEQRAHALHNQLRTLSVVRDLDDASRDVEQQVYEPGQVVVEEGAPGDAAYIVVDGLATVRTHQQVLTRIGRGQVFGERALVTAEPRVATVAAETRLTVLRVDGARFLSWLETHPPLRSLLGALSAVYRRPDGGFVTVHRGEHEGRPAITTVRALPAGGRMVATRLEHEAVLVISVERPGDPVEEEELACDRAPRTLRIRGGRPSGLVVHGKTDVGPLVDRLLDPRALSAAERARFVWTGELQRPSGASDHLACACLGVTAQEIDGLAGHGWSLDELRRDTGAGSVCGSCVHRLSARIAGRPSVEPSAPSPPAEPRALPSLDPPPAPSHRPRITVHHVLDRACRALLLHQYADGHFAGDVDQGTLPTAHTLILEAHLGVLDPADAEEMVRWLTHRMQPDGGFLAYPRAHFSTMTETCAAYGAFVAAGVPPRDGRLMKIRGWIEAHGGLTAADPIAQSYLVMAGILPPAALPSVRIEHVLMPGLERHIFRTFALYYGLMMMFILPGLLFGLRRGPAIVHERALGRRAMSRIVDFLIDHQNAEGNWAGSQWVTALALAALHALGVKTDHDAMVRGLACLRRLRRRDALGLQVISLNADVWNTAMALRVMGRVGLAREDERTAPWASRAIDYLLASQSSQVTPSDWTNGKPGAPRSGGWAFEADNPLGIDCDTTSMVLLALADHAEQPRVPVAMKRGVQWLLSMQHEEGGFAAFGRPRRVAPPGPMFMQMPQPPKGALAMLQFFVRPDFEFADVPTADLTGRVVSALSRVGGHRSRVEAAVRFLESQQYGDSWWGRWTTNYLAGTSFVLHGVMAAGVDPQRNYVRRAVRWMLSCQNEDGGFGEANETYQHPERAGQGPSNAYLTGLVLQALCATGHARSEGARRAARYLCDTQLPGGLWEETQAVQSMAPPELFYMNYVNYQTAPIEALAMHRDLA